MPRFALERIVKRLVLVRHDDPEVKIELVRWQIALRGFFGYTRTMVLNHRTPVLFPNSVWKIADHHS